jgi:FkbM family methyltransferase
MRAGAHDIRVLNEVWLDRIYEPTPEFRVRKGWTVLDLGGHKGSFAVQSALTDPTTRVHVLEPEPENLDYLRKNVALNQLGNVTVHAAAVSATSGEAVLHVGGRRGSGTNSLLREHVAGYEGASVSVRTERLDDLVAAVGGRVDLMKMDVEGAEYEVLHGVSAETLRAIRRIVLEYHAAAGLESDLVAADLQKHLEQHGFACSVAKERCLLFASRRDA